MLATRTKDERYVQKVDETRRSSFFPPGPDFVSTTILPSLSFPSPYYCKLVCTTIPSSSQLSKMGTLKLASFLEFAVVWLSLLGSKTVLAQFSIPERYDGFVYNGKPDPVMRGPVLWEVFIDPLCIDCKIGWPVVKQVADRYGSSLVVIVHPFPAPFHHNAFFACRALHVAQRTNASLVYPLLERIFATQDTFLNPNTNHETPAHVVSRLIALATDLGISANSFEAGFNDSVTDQATRISFKYGCSRGVVGTPTYLVNGVAVAGADESWSADQWAKVFDPVVKATGLGMIYPSS